MIKKIPNTIPVSADGVSWLSVPERMAFAFILRFVYAAVMLGGAWAIVGAGRHLAWCAAALALGSTIALFTDLQFARRDVASKEKAHLRENELQVAVTRARRERDHAYHDHEHTLALLDAEKAIAQAAEDAAALEAAARAAAEPEATPEEEEDDIDYDETEDGEETDDDENLNP